MNPWRITLIIALALFSVIRLAYTCSKMEEKKQKRIKSTDFSAFRSAIEKSQMEIFRYSKSDKDSIEWKISHRKAFNAELDSVISYYRDNYRVDEERYKVYLQLLYIYKNLSYTYKDWFNYQQDNINKTSKQKEYKEKEAAFYQELFNKKNELRMKEVDLMFIN